MTKEGHKNAVGTLKMPQDVSVGSNRGRTADTIRNGSCVVFDGNLGIVSKVSGKFAWLRFTGRRTDGQFGDMNCGCTVLKKLLKVV